MSKDTSRTDGTGCSTCGYTDCACDLIDKIATLRAEKERLKSDNQRRLEIIAEAHSVRIKQDAKISKLERLGDAMLYANDYHIEEAQEAWREYREANGQ